MLKCRWFQKKDWQEEIKRILSSGLKYELAALANKGFRYLTKTHPPEASELWVIPLELYAGILRRPREE
ncbi:MAG: hypothetical protein HYV94_07665 [Candidatus Rokubacteria bacterium]|nr:hypothetical protein [Candidatus Rokubacteria bacterium]